MRNALSVSYTHLPQYGVNGQLQFSTSSSVTTGNAFADLLLGNIGTFSQEQAALKMHEQYNIFEPFIQDDWHATPRLTLNVGLRMSFFGTYSEKNHLAWNFDPARYCLLYTSKVGDAVAVTRATMLTPGPLKLV